MANERDATKLFVDDDDGRQHHGARSVVVVSYDILTTEVMTLYFLTLSE